MTPELQNWAARGAFLDSKPLGHRVFLLDLGEATAGPDETLLLLHGFPESSYSFHKVVAGLGMKFARILLFDMLGYGLSDKPVEGYGYSLFEQADLALQVWRHVGIRGGHLLAHDMGDSVATELAARHVSDTLPAWFSGGLRSFTFTNGGMVLDLAKLRVSQRILLSRFGRVAAGLFNFRTFSQQVRSAHGAGGLGDEDLELLWDNLCQQGGQFKTWLTIRYLADRRRFEATRWLPALAQVREPVHLCWGDADAVAPVTIPHFLKAKVCTAARLTLMAGVGHFCQLSDPETWLEAVCSFDFSARFDP